MNIPGYDEKRAMERALERFRKSGFEEEFKEVYIAEFIEGYKEGFKEGYEEEYKKGYKWGRKEDYARIIVDSVKENLISKEEGAARLEITLDELEELLAES